MDNRLEADLRVVYDTDSGMAIIVKVDKTTILFDDSKDLTKLLKHLARHRIRENVDLVIMAHAVGDLLTGIKTLVKQNPEIILYLPSSVPDHTIRGIRQAGASSIRVQWPMTLTPNVFMVTQRTTHGFKPTLVIRTSKGLFLLGPSIYGTPEGIDAEIATLFPGQPLHAVIGFSELSALGNDDISTAIGSLKQLAPKNIWTCRCTGQLAKQAMSSNLPANHSNISDGTIIQL